MFGVYLSFLHKNLSILIVDLYYPSLSILIVQTPGAQLVSVCLPASPARPTQTQYNTQNYFKFLNLQIHRHTHNTHKYVKFTNLQIHRHRHNTHKNMSNLQIYKYTDTHTHTTQNMCFKFTNTQTHKHNTT